MFLHLFGAKSCWRFEQIITENDAINKKLENVSQFPEYCAFSRYKNEAATQMLRIFQIIAHFPDLKTRPRLKCFAFSRLLRIFQI